MQIYLCDDSESDILRLKHYLNKYAEEKGMFFEFATFFSGEELITTFCKSVQKPELMFMDILMSGLNGVDTARQLRNMDYQGGIIFTTSSTGHAMESYELNALYYLQKPYERRHFENAMTRCSFLLQKAKPHFTFTTKKKEISVPYKDIVFFETEQSHSILLHTLFDIYSFSGTLTQITRFFSGVNCFIPVGRSFLVNLNHVSGQIENDFVMSDGSIVQIPLRKRAEILMAWEKWQEETPL